MERNSGHDGIAPLVLGRSTIYLDLHDPRFLRVPGEVKEAEAQLAPFLRRGDTFVDSGANHGSFSLAAAGLVGPKGYIMAVEPQPRLAQAIGRTLQLTGVPFRLHRVALGSQSGSATLFRPLATSGSGGLIPAFSARSRHRSLSVPVSKLDDLVRGCTLPGRVLFKLDIEGSELHCLQGARHFLDTWRPRVLMEINPRALGHAETMRESLIDVLQKSRYRFAEIHTPHDVRPVRELRLIAEGDHREILLIPED